jgi:hypothetical protein
MERWLHKAALPVVKLALACQKALSNDERGAIEASRLGKLSAMCHQDISHVVRMVELDCQLAAQPKLHDITVISR